jgi:hypothetical protein
MNKERLDILGPLEGMLIVLGIGFLLERSPGLQAILISLLHAMWMIPVLFLVGVIVWVVVLMLRSIAKEFFADIRIVFLTPAAGAPMTPEQRRQAYRSES